MLSDRSKVGILFLCYTICIVTLWTSPSISLGSGSLRSLTPPFQLHCHAARNAARECTSTCEPLQNAAHRCDEVVRRAYRHVNLGGCASYLKISNACEDEWCQRGMDQNACRTECHGVRDALDKCTKGVVNDYFRKYGLEKDGTTKGI
jgi:hypothetical protein